MVLDVVYVAFDVVLDSVYVVLDLPFDVMHGVMVYLTWSLALFMVRFVCVALQKQAADRNRRDWEMKQSEDKFDQKIKEKDARMGDMALHIRTRDRQVMALEEKVRTRQHEHTTHTYRIRRVSTLMYYFVLI